MKLFEKAKKIFLKDIKKLIGISYYLENPFQK